MNRSWGGPIIWRENNMNDITRQVKHLFTFRADTRGIWGGLFYSVGGLCNAFFNQVCLVVIGQVDDLIDQILNQGLVLNTVAFHALWPSKRPYMTLAVTFLALKLIVWCKHKQDLYVLHTIVVRIFELVNIGTSSFTTFTAIRCRLMIGASHPVNLRVTTSERSML